MSHAHKLICPNSGEEITPLRTWESRLPDGQIIRYGQLNPHGHQGQECEWSYLVQALVEDDEQLTPLFI